MQQKINIVLRYKNRNITISSCQEQPNENSPVHLLDIAENIMYTFLIVEEIPNNIMLVKE